MRFRNVVKKISKWLAGIVAAVIIGSAVAWLAGFLDPWPPARVQLAFENFWSDDGSQPSEDHFRIVLCWLKDDSGEAGEAVASAFRSVGGVELVRSAQGVAARGAKKDWVPAMQQSALAVMEERHADLAIVGQVKEFKRWQELELVVCAEFGRRLRSISET